MKKLILVILILFFLFGCTNTNNNSQINNDSSQQSLQENTLQNFSSQSDSYKVSIEPITKIPSNLKVEKGDLIKIDFIMALENGLVIESTIDQNFQRIKDPISFIVGNKEVLLGIDEGVIGMTLGEEKILNLPPEKAFGFFNPNNLGIVKTQSLLDQNAKIEIGKKITINNLLGIIKESNDENTLIDFNNPFVGKNIIVWLKIQNIKKAL